MSERRPKDFGVVHRCAYSFFHRWFKIHIHSKNFNLILPDLRTSGLFFPSSGLSDFPTFRLIFTLKMKFLFLTLCHFLVISVKSASAQEQWKLKKQDGPIQVFSRSGSHTKFEELKVELTLNAKLSDLIAFLSDFSNYPNWSYNNRVTYAVKKINDKEIYFYSEINTPWPASDRDIVVHFRLRQDSISKVITIHADAVPDFIPAKDGLVRIPYSAEVWTIVPIDKSSIKIDYRIEVDPGASAPAWLVNLFSSNAPLQSFKHLSAQIKNAKYRNTIVPYIQN